MGEIVHPPGPVVCVVGARPNYMKMAPLLRAFASQPAMPGVVLVHTGQHYDVAMNGRARDGTRPVMPSGMRTSPCRVQT